MTRSQSLNAALSADAGVTALTQDRIYPLVALTPNAKTTLVYKFDVSYRRSLSGVGPIDATLEIRSWAVAYEVAHALADAVQAVLMPANSPKGFSGLLGGAGGINVIGCMISKESEGYTALSPDQGVFEVVSLYGLTYVL